jgi:hypothetical protein
MLRVRRESRTLENSLYGHGVLHGSECQSNRTLENSLAVDDNPLPRPIWANHMTRVRGIMLAKDAEMDPACKCSDRLCLRRVIRLIMLEKNTAHQWYFFWVCSTFQEELRRGARCQCQPGNSQLYSRVGMCVRLTLKA